MRVTAPSQKWWQLSPDGDCKKWNVSERSRLAEAAPAPGCIRNEMNDNK